MAFMEMETTRFLVREEGFDTEAFAIPEIGFFNEFHVGDQIDRMFVFGIPPGNCQNGAIGCQSKMDIGDTPADSGHNIQVLKGKQVIFLPYLDVFGRFDKRKTSRLGQWQPAILRHQTRRLPRK